MDIHRRSKPTEKYCDPEKYEQDKAITGTKAFENIFQSTLACCDFLKILTMN